MRLQHAGNDDLLGAVKVEAGAALGGGGRWDKISVRSAASDFPRVLMKVSTSNGTFFFKVENEIKTILLFEI